MAYRLLFSRAWNTVNGSLVPDFECDTVDEAKELLCYFTEVDGMCKDAELAAREATDPVLKKIRVTGVTRGEKTYPRLVIDGGPLTSAGFTPGIAVYVAIAHGTLTLTTEKPK